MTIDRNIYDARALFERAEKETDPALKAQSIIDAIVTLDDCAAENITPSERALIANLRVAHTRQLLTQVTALKSVAMDSWLSYIGLLLFFLKDEVDLVLKENYQLEKDFKTFLGLRRREFLESIGKK